MHKRVGKRKGDLYPFNTLLWVTYSGQLLFSTASLIQNKNILEGLSDLGGGGGGCQKPGYGLSSAKIQRDVE